MFLQLSNFVHLINEISWLAVLHGQGIAPREYHPLVGTLAETEILLRLKHIQAVIDKSADTMPLQKEFIAQHCQAQL